MPRQRICVAATEPTAVKKTTKKVVERQAASNSSERRGHDGATAVSRPCGAPHRRRPRVHSRAPPSPCCRSLASLPIGFGERETGAGRAALCLPSSWGTATVGGAVSARHALPSSWPRVASRLDGLRLVVGSCSRLLCLFLCVLGAAAVPPGQDDGYFWVPSASPGRHSEQPNTAGSIQDWMEKAPRIHATVMKAPPPARGSRPEARA